MPLTLLKKTLNVSRRNLFTKSFNAIVSTALLAALPITTVYAQNNVEPSSKQYKVLEKTIPTSVSGNKIEVVEFFWFGCPHCNSLDPVLEQWLKKAPADVVFKRVHINFGTPESPNKRTDIHQRLFYTLETLGLHTTLLSSVFTAIHSDKQSLADRDSILTWAKSKNLDMAKFISVFDDKFTMTRKQGVAMKLQTDYKVDGVPYFGVDGQFATSPNIAGGQVPFFNTLDALIQKARAKKNNAVASTVKTTTVNMNKTPNLK